MSDLELQINGGPSPTTSGSTLNASFLPRPTPALFAQVIASPLRWNGFFRRRFEHDNLQSGRKKREGGIPMLQRRWRLSFTRVNPSLHASAALASMEPPEDSSLDSEGLGAQSTHRRRQ
mmetsp:Transcript_8318/g.15212  ORF Transcript_8318/g.15212 Transcript_8318/m.15212 type:complete len:119 (-) Transcript_8318:178-534(-)